MRNNKDYLIQGFKEVQNAKILKKPDKAEALIKKVIEVILTQEQHIKELYKKIEVLNSGES